MFFKYLQFNSAQRMFSLNSLQLLRWNNFTITLSGITQMRMGPLFNLVPFMVTCYYLPREFPPTNPNLNFLIYIINVYIPVKLWQSPHPNFHSLRWVVRTMCRPSLSFSSQQAKCVAGHSRVTCLLLLLSGDADLKQVIL